MLINVLLILHGSTILRMFIIMYNEQRGILKCLKNITVLTCNKNTNKSSFNIHANSLELFVLYLSSAD